MAERRNAITLRAGIRYFGEGQPEGKTLPVGEGENKVSYADAVALVRTHRAVWAGPREDEPSATRPATRDPIVATRPAPRRRRR